MSRFERKKRPEANTPFNISGVYGVYDYADFKIKQTFYITDSEYDYLTEMMLGVDIDMLMIDRYSSFGKKRKCLEMIDRYLKEMK